AALLVRLEGRRARPRALRERRQGAQRRGARRALRREDLDRRRRDAPHLRVLGPRGGDRRRSRRGALGRGPARRPRVRRSVLLRHGGRGARLPEGQREVPRASPQAGRRSAGRLISAIRESVTISRYRTCTFRVTMYAPEAVMTENETREETPESDPKEASEPETDAEDGEV